MMSLKSKFLFAFTILMLLNQLEAFRKIYMKDIKCTVPEKSILKINECLVHVLSGGHDAVKLNVSLGQTITAGEVKINFQGKNGASKSFDTAETIDICNFKKEKLKSRPDFYIQMMDSTNMINQCPFKGFGIINDFYPRINFFHRLFMPKGEFELKLVWFLNKVKALETQLNLLVK